MVLSMRRTPGRAVRLALRLAAFVLACVLIMAASTARAELSAYFVDVGQGDGCIISCDGEHMLVDGGTVSGGAHLSELMSALGITHLKYAINTHPHSDHAGGMSAALEVASVDAAYSSQTSYTEQAFNDYISALEAQGLELGTLSAGDELALGGARVSVLSPLDSFNDLNDNSIVLRVTYGDTALLLMADAGEAAERALLDSGAELQADLIKIGHHGSSTSTSAELLARVSPAWAVISVGVDNEFGHPHTETLKRLSEVGVGVVRTDLFGDILAVSDGSTLTITDLDLTAQDGGRAITQLEATSYYIGNASTHKFHLPYCGTLPAGKNRVLLLSRDQAIEQGFSPCGNCEP